ncbi:MAG: NADH:flavin oxidoreductase/NADH oxidase family protein [Pseudomonadales bacterium]|nr:NADH:flavin oxidoreductase/NADH oxidase family protein [Pseudomonadales bacterium]
MTINAVDVLGQPLKLANGVVIKNRFAKSAMSETLGNTDNGPRDLLSNLYKTWALGGTGLLITGNVMVDRRALGEPNNVAMEDERHIDALKAWASASTVNDTHTWVQLNHPGKQSPNMLSKEPVAPSAIPLAKEFKSFFNPPRALTEDEILDQIERFGKSAAISKKAGFTGVQIHGAHGYLVSQFLSPHHNQRTDRWGGSIENRARFVMEIYQSIRTNVGADFPVSIKMNSADFQRGGFTEDESMIVAEMLADAGMDLIEISGGNYESPSMTGANVKASTKAREAYFLSYAEDIRKRIDTPLMVTGGFRTELGMAQAVASGATDLVGYGRPLAVEPDFPNKILNGESFTSQVRPRLTGIKAIDERAMMETAWYTNQLNRIAQGKKPRVNEHPLVAFMRYLTVSSLRGVKTQRLRANS